LSAPRFAAAGLLPPGNRPRITAPSWLSHIRGWGRGTINKRLQFGLKSMTTLISGKEGNPGRWAGRIQKHPLEAPTSPIRSCSSRVWQRNRVGGAYWSQ